MESIFLFSENNAENHYHVDADEWKNLEGYALVINGPSLTYALKRELERTFLDIGCLCRVCTFATLI